MPGRREFDADAADLGPGGEDDGIFDVAGVDEDAATGGELAGGEAVGSDVGQRLGRRAARRTTAR